jgi:hypothetical protein
MATGSTEQTYSVAKSTWELTHTIANEVRAHVRRTEAEVISTLTTLAMDGPHRAMFHSKLEAIVANTEKACQAAEQLASDNQSGANTLVSSSEDFNQSLQGIDTSSGSITSALA